MLYLTNLYYLRRYYEKENSVYSDTVHNAYLYACNSCVC